MTLLFALGANAPATAQTQQKRQQQELVDSTGQDEFEAFSDTTLTETDSAVNRAIHIGDDWDDDWDDDDFKVSIDELFKNVNADDLAGMVFALLVILIVFVFFMRHSPGVRPFHGRKYTKECTRRSNRP